MIKGHASPEGTRRFAQESGADPANYAEFAGLSLSNVGMGTYLGEPDDATDALVSEAVKRSVLAGINVIDTAINYRAQKAERSVGRAVADLLKDGRISRDQIFVSSKNGYVTNDADVGLGFWDYVKEEYSQRGVISEGDVTSGYHCMTPRYLEDQLDRSLANLGLECVDLMYLHNGVEGQLRDVSMPKFLENLASVFEFYEQKRRQGKILFYGMATWECFRVSQDNPQYLSLERVAGMAREAGGEGHGFRFVQLPYNLHYDQALLSRNQQAGGEAVSILDACSRLGIGAFTSVPFMQGRLLGPGVVPEFGDPKPSLRSLQFVRSTPGVIAPLVGQKSAQHVSENLEIMGVPPMGRDEFGALVAKLTS